MRYIIHSLFLLAGIWFLPLNAQETVNEKRALEVYHSISSHDLLRHVTVLSGEEFGGRLTGTEGYRCSAGLVAGLFRDYGLAPAAAGSYLQVFRIPYTLVYPGCSLTLLVPFGDTEIRKNYSYYDEFVPGSTSDSGSITSEVVYVGYGITAPELGYDDYRKVDVKGKIVLMEREVPVPPSDTALFRKWYPYSFHQYKLKNAVAHGATGMLYNYGPLANPNNHFSEGFILTHVGEAVVEDLFRGTGKVHSELVKAIRRDLSPRSFRLGKKVSIYNSTRHFPEGTGYNVAGFIEGTDPALKDEIILIGAHLDHLGYCYEMMPGANDNASGIAVLLELAKAFSSEGIQTGRSLLFIAFGAEEQALVGSKHYIEHPLFPLQKTTCLINLDGVGVGTRLYATGGENYPGLWKFFDEANGQFLHQDLRTGHFMNNTRPRLDAAIFMNAGVPAFSFSSQGTPSPYHVPADNPDIITPEIMEDIARLIFMSVYKMANTR